MDTSRIGVSIIATEQCVVPGGLLTAMRNGANGVLIHAGIITEVFSLLTRCRSYSVGMKHSSIDPRVLHSGKAGKHHTRVRDERTGRRRKPKRQLAKHLRYRGD